MSKTEHMEYIHPVELHNADGYYFQIPGAIIYEKGLNRKLVGVFSFLSVRKGISGEMNFSINSIVDWYGKKPNRGSNGINTRIKTALFHLVQEGYLEMEGGTNWSTVITGYFNKQKLQEQCNHDRFAVIYVDELKKIMDYKLESTKDAYFNSDIILLVFAYLRMKISRRRNRLLPEEINVGNKNNQKLDIATRRERSPDAYDCQYKEIAADLGITPRMVAKAVLSLNDLGLIYSEPLPRVNKNNKWHTENTIFCNQYKREGSFLLASGKEYYGQEVENKRKRIKAVSRRKEV